MISTDIAVTRCGHESGDKERVWPTRGLGIDDCPTYGRSGRDGIRRVFWTVTPMHARDCVSHAEAS
jgi:hypothetical protein